MLPTKKNVHGQAVLLVLLGMAAVLTLVLSVVSRSVSDISVTSRDEESSKAYSLAEKGIEALLLNPLLDTSSLGEGVSANAEEYPVNSSIAEFDPIKAGQSDTAWFVSHDEDGFLTCEGSETCMNKDNLKIETCWGNPSTDAATDNTPAAEISFYFDPTRNSVSALNRDYSGIQVVRKIYDPHPSRRLSNKFENPSSCNIPGGGYSFSSGAVSIIDLVPAGCLDSVGCLLFARVKLIYNNDIEHAVGLISSNGPLPQQGWKISSTGTSGDATRKVETIQYFPEPLDIFDNSISSFGIEADLSKE